MALILYKYKAVKEGLQESVPDHSLSEYTAQAAMLFFWNVDHEDCSCRNMPREWSLFLGTPTIKIFSCLLLEYTAQAAMSFSGISTMKIILVRVYRASGDFIFWDVDHEDCSCRSIPREWSLTFWNADYQDLLLSLVRVYHASGYLFFRVSTSKIFPSFCQSMPCGWPLNFLEHRPPRSSLVFLSVRVCHRSGL